MTYYRLSNRQPVDLVQVQLIFDTGLHHVLTLSHSDAYVERMRYGVAQPETVRDYTVEAEVAGVWTEIANGAGNYSRLVVHDLETPVQTIALRLTVLATNGLDHARLCEIRAYQQVRPWID